MKNILLVILFSVLIFGFYSCEENFSPKGEFKDKYILNCIIRGDTTVQVATISKSYNVEGYDAALNSKNPFIDVEDVRLWQNNNVYIFKDSSENSPPQWKYDSPLKYYYTKGFQPSKNDSLEIRVVLKGGKKLVGYTKLPAEVTFDVMESTKKIPDPETDEVPFVWKAKNTNSWYLSKFSLYYMKNVNGQNVRLTKEIPIGYTDINGAQKAMYPQPSRTNRIVYQKSDIDSVMQQISAGDPNKSNYTIFGCVLDLLVFDDNLSKYYSNLNGFMDDYTVRVDQTDFTNIEGGLGIFGSYIHQKRGAVFYDEYIKSFGYNVYNP